VFLELPSKVWTMANAGTLEKFAADNGIRFFLVSLAHVFLFSFFSLFTSPVLCVGFCLRCWWSLGADELGGLAWQVSYVDLLGVVRSKLVPSAAIGGMQKVGAGFAGYAAHFNMTAADPDMVWYPFRIHALDHLGQLLQTM
jgi:hypothetical protein